MVELNNDRQYREEFILSREKNLKKINHEYYWIGREDSRVFVDFPISVDVLVARYHYGCGQTEMSLERICNGRKEQLFSSEDDRDYDKFQEIIETWKQKGFQQY